MFIVKIIIITTYVRSIIFLLIAINKYLCDLLSLHDDYFYTQDDFQKNLND